MRTSNIEALGTPTLVYADDQVVVACKPAGMPTQADPSGDPDLLSWVRGTLADVHIELVNRIDRPVCGLVLLAREPAALATLNEDLREGRIHKTYRAIVEGRVELPAEGLLLSHHLVHDTHVHKARVVHDPQRKDPPGELRLTTLTMGDRYTLVEVVPRGGAFHQIRAQLGAWGHAIKGDVKYGARRGERGADGPARSIALHAYELRFVHPMKGDVSTFQAPIPLGRLWQVLWPPDASATSGPRP
jgi:23S rRNA pseudouridine1911/1915/1917 synthase